MRLLAYLTSERRRRHAFAVVMVLLLVGLPAAGVSALIAGGRIWWVELGDGSLMGFTTVGIALSIVGVLSLIAAVFYWIPVTHGEESFITQRRRRRSSAPSRTERKPRPPSE